MKIIRFIVAGSAGFAINVGVLYFLVSIVGVRYLAASVVAVTLSLIVGFTLQKYLTFREPSAREIPRQGTLYIGYFVYSVLANTLLLFLFVEFASLHYLVGQIFASLLLALGSYFFYDKIIFKTLGAVQGNAGK